MRVEISPLAERDLEAPGESVIAIEQQLESRRG